LKLRNKQWSESCQRPEKHSAGRNVVKCFKVEDRIEKEDFKCGGGGHSHSSSGGGGGGGSSSSSSSSNGGGGSSGSISGGRSSSSSSSKNMQLIDTSVSAT